MRRRHGVVHLTPPQGRELAALQVHEKPGKKKRKKRKKRSTSKEAPDANSETNAESPKKRIGGFNFKKSIAHFRVAARSGHVLAMHKLAHMALHGLGMEKPNCGEAVRLFKVIAERGPQADNCTG